MPRDAHPREHLTATGIRIVGKAATELVAQAAGSDFGAPSPGDVLWVGRFQARPRLGAGSAVPAILKVLHDRIRTDWDACPELTRHRTVTRPPGRFQGLSWDAAGEPGAWRGELLWRQPHPVVAGTPCLTHLVIDEQQHRVTLTLSVAAERGTAGVRGPVGAGQARPDLLDALRAAVSLTADGAPPQPEFLAVERMEWFVSEILLGDHRQHPVAILAPREAGGYLVDPESLAVELFGLAPLYVMESHACTFRLTDAVGDRRLSAYWGALRVYRPEFSCADRSEDHWLLMRDRIGDPIERAALLGRIAQAAVPRLLPVDGVAAWRRAAAPEPTAATPEGSVVGREADSDATGKPADHPAADPAANHQVAAAHPVATMQLDRISAQLTELSGTLAHLLSAQDRIVDEIARMRTASVVRAAELSEVERRLAELGRRLDPATESSEPEEPSEPEPQGERPPTLVEVVQQAASELIDHLMILDAAEQAAADSPFEDPGRVAAVLEAMALVARRRRDGRLDTGLRAAFLEVGVDYRSGIADSTSDRLRQQYRFQGPNGQAFECFEHIAIGSTYDPRRCLRIYFTSRAPNESRFVIGHVGRHFRVLTSS